MEITSALALANSLVYKPGWLITAADHSDRFEGAIKVCVAYPARNYNRENAPDYLVPVDASASFPLIVRDMDDTALYRAILGRILHIEAHEAREALRIAPTMWAPFHPHRADGMARWGDIDGDLLFGVC